MPRVERQSPNQARGNGKPKGGFLAAAVPVSEVPDLPVKITVYGRNGVGKTNLASQFPKPLLMLDFEPEETCGAETVAGVDGVEYIKVTSSEQAYGIAAELEGDTYYKTHVLDSATGWQRIRLKEILGVTALPEQLNFGAVSSDQYRLRSELMKESLARYLRFGVNTVFTAKEYDHNPPKEEKTTTSGKAVPDMRAKWLRGLGPQSAFGPELGGAVAGWLMDACACVARLYVDRERKWVESRVTINKKEEVSGDWVETGEFIRCLLVSYHPNYMARVRSRDWGSMPDVIERPTYDKIIKVIRGGKL